MKVHSSIRKLHLFLLMAGILVGSGCRKQVTASDMDMSEYGWVLYSEGKFTKSNEWFINAVIRDTSYKDGYNGQGWTYGKIGEIDSSIARFTVGRTKALSDTTWQDEILLISDPPHDPALECTAGLALAYHAKNSHLNAVQYGLDLLERVNDNFFNVTLGQPAWNFSRDVIINSKHIIWTISSSYFALGMHTESLDYANRLNVVDSTFNTETVEGIQKLSIEIARLRLNL